MSLPDEKRKKVDNILVEKLDYNEGQIEDLSDEEKKQLVEMYGEEMESTLDGVDLKPARLKINKDIQKFVDPFDNTLEKVEGVIVYKHKARGYWPSGGGKVPECSSMDGRTGTITDTSETRKCARCPHNEWGSAESDGDEPSKGKACKEMRRLYIDIKDYELPVMLSLPPTSINEFDEYINARSTKGIPDLFKEAIITLREEESHGYTYAVAKFSIGDNVDPQRIMKLKDQREKIKEYAAQEDITKEDYEDMEKGTEEDVDLDDTSVDDIA